MPSPAAAGVIAGFIWATTANDFQRLPWVAWILAVTLGFTMVSNIKYYSGKKINLRKAVPFSVVVLISFFVILVINSADNLPELLFLTFLSYFLSGFVAWLVVYFKRRRAQRDLRE